MTLILLILILVAVIVASVRAARIFSSTTKKDRELARVRDDRTTKLIQQLREIVNQVITTEKFLGDYQLQLHDKLNEISRVADQLREFTASDTLVARRNELSRTKELKSVLERIISITTSSRQEVATSDMLALEMAVIRIHELETILTEGS